MMKALIDIGNPDAPQGSEPWCRSFHQTICRLKREGQFAVSNLKYSLREFRDGKHYTRLTDAKGDPFQTWDSFVQSREPYGLGMQTDVAHAIINEKDDGRLLRDVMGKHGQYGKGRPKPNRGDNITSKRGTSRAYILDRLQRDRPDLAAKVEAGKLSARAAGIEAGFIEPSRPPVDRALKLLPKLTRAQLRHLRARIDQLLRESEGKRAA